MGFLIRFDSDAVRGPSACLFQGMVDWVRGSLSTALGTSLFNDFKPYNTGDIAENGSSGHAVTLRTDNTGVIRLAATAGSNAQEEVTFPAYFDPSAATVTALEFGTVQNAAANSPQSAVGLTDVAAGSIYASGAIASGSAQNTLALRVNVDKTVDIVAVVNGTLTVLKTNCGISAVWSATQKLGLKIEKMTPTRYRLTPVIGGNVARKGAINVASTAIPLVPMKPFVGTTVLATTAPSLDVDFICVINK